MFFSKPTGGPDLIGGIFPVDFPSVKCINRSGTAHAKGDVVQLALTPGAATEIATNDDNSYIPGASNDTVWNTVIDPRSNATVGSSIQRGALFGVCISTVVSDNKIGEYKFFGLIEEAFCIDAATAPVAGDPLTVTVAKNFDGVILSSEVIAATYMDTQTAITTRAKRRVFLHNGFFPVTGGQGYA